MMFVMYSLTLDAYVLRDHHITRPNPKKRKSSINTDILAKPVPQAPDNKEDKTTTSNGLAGLFGWMRQTNVKSTKKNGVRKLIDKLAGDKSKTNILNPIDGKLGLQKVLMPNVIPFADSNLQTKDKVQLSDLFNSRELRNS